MSQIIKAFMGVFLTLFMAVTAMGILAAYMEVMNAQDMQARLLMRSKTVILIPAWYDSVFCRARKPDIS